MFHSCDYFVLLIRYIYQAANIDCFEHREFRILELVGEAVEDFVVAAGLLLDVPDHRVEKFLERAVLEGHEVTRQTCILIC